MSSSRDPADHHEHHEPDDARWHEVALLAVCAAVVSALALGWLA